VRNRWTLEIDTTSCIGSGLCASTAPEHFELSGDVSKAKEGEIDADERVLGAANLCPTAAIVVRSMDGAVVAPAEDVDA